MILTFWVILVTVGSLFFVGLPATEIIYGSKKADETFWIKTPFVGLAIIVLILQNLVYLDLPLGLTTPIIWVLALLLWGWLFVKQRAINLFRVFPYGVYGVAGGVFLLHSLGLFLVGARYYVGRAWVDQWNYIAWAQFLTDFPYSLPYTEMDHVLYIAKAISLKQDRIGQSIFHGFLAASTLTDAKTTFEPTILLAPFLTILAIYLLTLRLGFAKKVALATAFFAGILPGITLVHLESFFSQALAIPLLIIWPVWVKDALDNRRWSDVVTAALLLALATTVYTEFYIIFLGVAVVVLTMTVIYRLQKTLQYLATWLSIIIIALLLNPGFIRGIVQIFTRVSIPGVLDHIYPWAYQAEGIQRLWFGEFFATLSTFNQSVLINLSILLIITAYAGLILQAAQTREALSLAVLSIVTLPVLVRLGGEPYKYQFYKIFLSVCPLYPVGIMALWVSLQSFQWWRRLWSSISRRLVIVIPLIVVILLSTWGTIDMVWRSADPHARWRIGAHNFELISPAMMELQDKLTQISNQNILIAEESPVINGWLVYFARHNRLWLTNPNISDISIAAVYPAATETDSLQRLPDDTLVLAQNLMPSKFNPSAIWAVQDYGLWRIKEIGKNKLLVIGFNNPNGIEVWDSQLGFWLGTKPTEIYILSGQSGTITLKANFIPGPSLPENPERYILIKTGFGYNEEVNLTADERYLFIPIETGVTRITLESLDEPSVDILPNGDTRALMLGIAGPEIVDFR